jgi:hypothetical protein
LWITNPVYNTGVYSLEECANELLTMAEQGTLIVLDETLALTPTVFANVLGGHPNVIGIYTPHKAICVNGLKFSIVTFHSDLEDFFDDWGDVLFGGLSISAVTAISHFLSPEFDAYREAFLTSIERTRGWHNKLLAAYADRIVTDIGSRGHFLTTYFPSVGAALGSSLSFIEATIDATGAAFIPGNRSGFDPAFGFCFRVNLAPDSPKFRGALSRLYHHLIT